MVSISGGARGAQVNGLLTPDDRAGGAWSEGAKAVFASGISLGHVEARWSFEIVASDSPRYADNGVPVASRFEL
jgi:hypothetical protein